MNKNLLDKVTVSKSALFVFLIIALTIGAIQWARIVPEEKWLGPVVYGLASGLIVYLFSFITGVYSLNEIERNKDMGVLAVLPNRHDKEYYRKYLSKARKEVLVLGASGTRFLNDFLDPQKEDKIMYSFLQNNERAKLKILVPTDEYMSSKSKASWDMQSDLRSTLLEKLGDRIEFRRFDEPPHLSFVVVDDEIITGPIFPGVESEYLPVIHIKRNNDYSEKHVQYFERLWNESSSSSVP